MSASRRFLDVQSSFFSKFPCIAALAAAVALGACGREATPSLSAAGSAPAADASTPDADSPERDIANDAGALPLADAGTTAHLDAACSSKSCTVRVSRDGRIVATTDGKLAVFVEPDTHTQSELTAKDGESFVTVSATHRMALVRKGNAFSLRGADGKENAALSRKLAGASKVILSEDGERAVVFAKGGAAAADESCPKRWIDLATSQAHGIVIPSVAAGGSSETCKWVRRRGVQIFQSRIGMAFADYTTARANISERKGLYILDNFGFVVDNVRDVGVLLGADIDDGAHAIAVARIPAVPEKIGRAPIIEMAPVDTKKHATKRWPIEGHFVALWLSPDGSRLLLRTKQNDATSLSVWDTQEGRKLGVLDFDWDGFEFTPDGKRLVVASKGEFRFVDLP
ncbi:hypothetical protein LZC95_38350 [Pendulispora brunnea]|uniref:Uncharacterized protein n=1 Tax=Pendulispora brunnea TaxID=2905690 RepID=A0ABZ2K419_9BACT